MINKVISIGNLNAKLVSSNKESQASAFTDVLAEALKNVNNDCLKAEQLTQDFALGKEIELHQVVLAAEQANMAFQLTVQVRNKILESYQEIMRMQI